uniref:Uncharacterized protein n=1 Tax=viral metagenome TaxID=1070528 RepID=A0A6M3IZV6_9ZZZZ
MYIDANLLLSDGQVICDAASEMSSYSVDLKAARKVWGGKQLYVVVIVDVAIDTATSIDFRVVTDTEETLSSPTIQITTGPIAIASLTANRAPIVIPIGSAIGTEEQFLGLYYVLAGSANVSGAVTAFVAFDAPGNP